MERSEKLGLGVALAGHAALFGLLSVGFLATPNPERLRQQPVEVSLVPDVALEAAAPAATEAPSQAEAPETGAPSEAPPPAPSALPLPQVQEAPPLAPIPTARPAPPDRPAPRPKPQPKPEPDQTRPEPKRQPAPSKPAPRPQPAPKPVAKASARPRPAPAAEKAPAKQASRATPSRSSARSAAQSSSGSPPARTASNRTATASGSRTSSSTRGAGQTASAKPAVPRQSRLGVDFLKGLTAEKSATRNADAPPSAARVDARTLASIVQAIARQIQPCADRQVDPGPGANEIVTTLNLRLNRDGTLSSTPRMVRQTGVSGENERYAQRVADLGVAAFKACAPLRLPAEYYSTANGGWSNINYNWKLR